MFWVWLLVPVHLITVRTHLHLLCVEWDIDLYSAAVASPGLVARRGKDGNYVMGHSQQNSGLCAAAAR